VAERELWINSNWHAARPYHRGLLFCLPCQHQIILPLHLHGRRYMYSATVSLRKYKTSVGHGCQCSLTNWFVRASLSGLSAFALLLILRSASIVCCRDSCANSDDGVRFTDIMECSGKVMDGRQVGFERVKMGQGLRSDTCASSRPLCARCVSDLLVHRVRQLELTLG